MSNINGAKFQIFVDGIQTGNIGGWRHIPLMVASQWEEGSEGEKLEVLFAMRKTYNIENESDIRDSHGKTASQVGIEEGFTELRYKRAVSSASQIVILSSKGTLSAGNLAT